MIKISWLVLYFATSGAAIFGFILCALVSAPKNNYVQERKAPTTPPTRKDPLTDLPCSLAHRCPMANDIYCAECEARQA